MDVVFNDFRTAYETGNGYELSQTLSPISPASDPDRLDKFYRSTNFQHVQRDFKNRIMNNLASPFTLPAEEGNGWVDVYQAYWKAVGEILKAEAAAETSTKVSGLPNHYRAFCMGSEVIGTTVRL